MNNKKIKKLLNSKLNIKSLIKQIEIEKWISSSKNRIFYKFNENLMVSLKFNDKNCNVDIDLKLYEGYSSENIEYTMKLFSENFFFVRYLNKMKDKINDKIETEKALIQLNRFLDKFPKDILRNNTINDILND